MTDLSQGLSAAGSVAHVRVSGFGSNIPSAKEYPKTPILVKSQRGFYNGFKKGGQGLIEFGAERFAVQG